MKPGAEIGLKIDQTLTQDATGTMAYLQFEAMGVDRVRTELSVSYVDHNTLQMGFRNPDDHRYLRTVAKRYGIIYSPPGTGICHQLHLENFAKPGKTLIGSDSHTPTAGGVGALDRTAEGQQGVDDRAAIGAGLQFVEAVVKPDYVNAKLEFKNALQIDPQYAPAYHMLGVTGIREGNLRQAYGMLQKTVELDPALLEARAELGKVLLLANERERAREQGLGRAQSSLH